MSHFKPDITPRVLGACQTQAEEIAAALGRALDAPFDVQPGEPAKLNTTALPDGWDAAGLVLLLQAGDEAALILLSEQTQLLPDWCATPDESGQARLDRLAAELAALVLPESIPLDAQMAGWVEDLSATLDRGLVESGAEMLPLGVESGDAREAIYLVWPAKQPGAVLPHRAPRTTANDAPALEAEPTGTAPRSNEPADEFARLPLYTRSMLRIEVPLVVKLASTRQTIDEILELGPGAIIKFDKSCEQLLDLEIGGHSIAQGEAVKVGDKFGLRINSMVLPSERFRGLRGE